MNLLYLLKILLISISIKSVLTIDDIQTNLDYVITTKTTTNKKTTSFDNYELNIQNYLVNFVLDNFGSKLKINLSSECQQTINSFYDDLIIAVNEPILDRPKYWSVKGMNSLNFKNLTFDLNYFINLSD